MARHNDFGKKGEELAAAWLIEKGYKILHRNWRHARYEVDVIAHYQGVLHFIEVKSGSGGVYGHPEERVDKKKIRNLMRGASTWIHQFPGAGQIRYDVLSITIHNGADPEYFFIGDVYLH